MKGKAAVELQLKHFNLKIQKAATKNIAITEKSKAIFQTNQIYQSRALINKDYP